MSLSPEWFDDSADRIKKWDEEGLSLKEAEKALWEIHSTAYPIATEMAEYILENWTARRVAMLGQESRRILFEIWDNHLS
jgi:hypothetical protein